MTHVTTPSHSPLMIRVLEVTIIAILSGLFWWQRGGTGALTLQSATDVGGLLFFVVLFLAFQSLFQVRS